MTPLRRPQWGVVCLCGCGEFTDGWLYSLGHTKNVERVDDTRDRALAAHKRRLAA